MSQSHAPLRRTSAGCLILLSLALPAHAQPPTVEPQSDSAAQDPLTDKLDWENLTVRVSQFFARNGLDGAILVTRDGEVVLNAGYGKANREANFDNTTDTIFAIGSCPIDFTHAAVLRLKDSGKLNLNDPITRFFDNVPEDKHSITIHHLMTQRSGLPNFHDIPTDKDPNHTFIDRDEAVRRIFAQQLLFEPGQGIAPSHSAWGLLAAIVEIQSGQTYPEFTREHLFNPAGMKDTGFNGEELPEERVAVGYGYRNAGQPNSPPHWGKTSWLVMGSGGQVSTLSDIHRWEVAMHEGRILSKESTEQYLAAGRGTSRDGNMYGFEFYHSHNPDSLFMLICNSINSQEERQAFDEMGLQLGTQQLCCTVCTLSIHCGL
jgi:CubicO group peptidase (beta-lactamase class C family)